MNKLIIDVDSIEEFLDKSLLVIVIALAFLATVLIDQGVTVNQLLFFDISLLPWGEIWEWLQTLGVTGAAARGLVWAWRKFGGDKYAILIWHVLDESPHPITKKEIQEKVNELIGENDIKKFNHKFMSAWKRMRKMKEISKVSSKESPRYKLAQDD